MYKTKDILIAAAYFTALEGYHPVSEKESSTKSKVQAYLDSNSVESLVEYQSRAEKAIAWLKGAPSSDWINSIKTAVTKKEVEPFMIGVISSLFSGYDSSLHKNDDTKSTFQGTPQEALEIPVSTIRLLMKGPSKFNKEKNFYLYKIVDTNGNVYIWYSDKDCTEPIKTCKLVRAIVKAHKEREGVQQTIIDVKELDSNPL